MNNTRSLIFAYIMCITTISVAANKYQRSQGKIARTLQNSEVIAMGNAPEKKLDTQSGTRTIKIDKPLKTELMHTQPSSGQQAQKTSSGSTQEAPAFDQKKFTYPLQFQHPKKNDEKTAQEALKTLAPEEPEEIEFQFENADLQNFVKQIEEIFKVNFIPDDAIQPLKAGSKQIKGNKITYKTNKALTKKDAWDLFVTFLGISGFAIVPHIKPNTYRIESTDAALKGPLTTFFGIDHNLLPDNDELIRYVYFFENSTPDTIKNIISPMLSSPSSLLILQEHRAFILTDKAYNIKTLMNIVKELDKVTMPQSMSVLKLRRVDAQQVKLLYDSLIQADDKNQPRYAGAPPRKTPTSLFFPENIRIITEPRTNALILLGAQDAIQKIEEFIIKHIDVELDQAHSPLHVIQLKFASAETIAEIMSNVTTFGQNTPAGQNGGVRGEDKYLRQMSFTAEKETNRVIVKGNYEDFLRVKDIIEKLDEAQPQVIVEVLILSITLDETRELGMQIRSKTPSNLNGLLGNNIKFQTSGLFTGNGIPSSIVENPAGPGVQRLLGNLLNLVTGAGPANTIVTLGQDMFGVWGLLQALQQITNLQIVSNPFVFATNKTQATVGIGQTRRVNTGTIVGSTTSINSMGSDEALLTIQITPQINSDGMIILDLVVDITNFVNPTNFTDPTKNTQKVVTKTIVADKEVIALGGLIRNTINNVMNQTPLLGNIPVLGWFFKNKHKEEIKENLLILLSTRIIKPEETSHINTFTQERLADYYGTMDEMRPIVEKRDPIHRLFFDSQNTQEKIAENFLFDRQKRSLRRRNKRNKKNNNNNKQPEKIVVSDTQIPAQNQIVQAQLEPTLSNIAASLQANATQSTENKLKQKINTKKRKRASLTNLVSSNEQQRVRA